jgi:hypothetical protein
MHLTELPVYLNAGDSRVGCSTPKEAQTQKRQGVGQSVWGEALFPAVRVARQQPRRGQHDIGGKL